MRVLVICDDFWHPATTVKQGLSVFKQDDIEFDWIEDAADWSPEKMATYPVVLFVKLDNVKQTDKNRWVTEEVQQAFVNYVRAGNGLFAVHSGTVYKDHPVMRALLGGAFINHPPQCPVTIEAKAGHPLAADTQTCTLTDEHYQMELDDTDADVYMTTTSEHGTMPGAWTRTEGEGRVCVLTPGHTVEVWQHPTFQALLNNGIRWCAGA